MLHYQRLIKLLYFSTGGGGENKLFTRKRKVTIIHEILKYNTDVHTLKQRNTIQIINENKIRKKITIQSRGRGQRKKN